MVIISLIMSAIIIVGIVSASNTQEFLLIKNK